MSRARIGLSVPPQLPPANIPAYDLPDRWIDQLVIAGDLTQCADRIVSLAGQGIDHVRR